MLPFAGNQPLKISGRSAAYLVGLATFTGVGAAWLVPREEGIGPWSIASREIATGGPLPVAHRTGIPFSAHSPPHRASLQPGAGSGATPAPAGPQRDSLDDLPPELVQFLLGLAPEYLQQSSGVYGPASSTIASDPALWRQVATQLADEPAATVEVLRWLASQKQQPGAYVAIAVLGGEAIRLGALEAAGGDFLRAWPAMAAAIGGVAFQPSKADLAALGSLEFIPQAVLTDIQARLQRGSPAYGDLLSAVAQAPDKAVATSLLALGGAAAAWDAAFAAADTPGRRTAAEVATGLPDVAVIDQLLQRMSMQDGGLSGQQSQARSLELAAQWAQQQLSGDRLSRVEALMLQGAFQGPGYALLVTLLSNAEDREGALEVAGQAGIVLGPTRNPGGG
jgi:hypothetical protein